MHQIAFKVQNLAVAYHDRLVLQVDHLAVPAGEVIALLGPNGAGKSTLLKAALGLIPALNGQVEFFGQPLKQVRKLVGYMPQAAEVDWDFPATVLDTVLMGTYGKVGWWRRTGKQEKALAQRALHQVGIADLHNRQISQLSGGQKQRTFMARILAQDPELFIMDEPFAGVDMASQHAIIKVLNQLRQQGKTVIIVHHDLSTIRQFCTWVGLLQDGKVRSAGPIDDVFKPEVVAEIYGLHESIFK